MILWENFYDETLAKKAFDKWNKAGQPKGITLEKLERKIDKIISDLEQNRDLLVYLASKIKSKFDEKINQKSE